ncbi:hypothetical protein N5K55_03875 (plasmid) [Pseudomonas aeruginosa]|nr:hypothetical protein [Pseudomonas aeruginosa]
MIFAASSSSLSQPRPAPSPSAFIFFSASSPALPPLISSMIRQGLNGISVQVAVRVEHQAAGKGVVRILDQCSAIPIVTERDTQVTHLSDTAKATSIAWIALGWLV